jgi:intein/homing endonuclease
MTHDSLEVDTVVNVLNRYTDHIYKLKVGNENIEVTSEHPFYVVGKNWVMAKDIKVGDKLKTSSKSELTISEINYNQVEIMVYNVEVNKNKNYFVTKSGVLVHNKKITNKQKDKK